MEITPAEMQEVRDRLTRIEASLSTLAAASPTMADMQIRIIKIEQKSSDDERYIQTVRFMLGLMISLFAIGGTLLGVFVAWYKK